MGDGLLYFYNNKCKKELKIAFFATLIIALLIHIYKFTNTLPNHDSVYNYYSDQNVLGSGRWALSLACGISSYFDLPWVNGFLSCVFIALTVVVIVALFKIKNPVLICLTSGLIASSPATTETFFFLFTADGYMMAMLLASMAVYLSRIEEKRILMLVLSGMCICISCGIYQAYVSFALILAVCYFMYSLLKNEFDKKSSIQWVLRQIIIFGSALAFYYVIWKVCMSINGVIANNYQGISQIGTISVGMLINGLISSIKNTLLFFIQWNVLEHGFSLYSVLNMLFLLSLGLVLVSSIVKSKIFMRKWAFILLMLCLIAIVPFSCIWNFVSESVDYRAMMLQCLTLLFVFCGLLYEEWGGQLQKDTICLFLILIVANNSIMANVSYFYMNQCYERTYAEGLEMMLNIHDFQEDYDIERIAFVGNRIYDVQLEGDNEESEKMNVSGKLHILSSLLETSLLFDNEHTFLFLESVFGLELEKITEQELASLEKNETVINLDCWPSSEAFTIIDDILVIKLSDEME